MAAAPRIPAEWSFTSQRAVAVDSSYARDHGAISGVVRPNKAIGILESTPHARGPIVF